MTTIKYCRAASVSTTSESSTEESGAGALVFYRSPDRTLLAGIFDESGTTTVTYDYTEFLVVIRGSATCRVDGEQPVTLSAGDAALIPAGSVVHFILSDDFRDAVCMVGDSPLPI